MTLLAGHQMSQKDRVGFYYQMSLEVAASWVGCCWRSSLFVLGAGHGSCGSSQPARLVGLIMMGCSRDLADSSFFCPWGMGCLHHRARPGLSQGPNIPFGRIARLLSSPRTRALFQPRVPCACRLLLLPYGCRISRVRTVSSKRGK